ncbi:hypothetical protein ACS0TY_018741 [Phlomoides rotata]
MCSRFLKRSMDNYQGDLTDILRATAANPPAAAAPPPDWQFPPNPVQNFTACPVDDFGDPFTHLGDPLLHDINTPVSPFFHTTDIVKDDTAGFVTAGSVNFSLDDDEQMKRPNFFSRMLQISPTAKLPLPPSPAAATASNDRSFILGNNSKSCLVESPGLQISSPRNTGIRRRKSQAKKVVCIPAPAPANSRPSGEIVPSDLWAWRKYGQKPIKGSPYPRGYYRCSSSKGCSARKQVERSRTDPNMLVITYTSEHNHPWPTQRNALAGSTRTPPATKTTTSAKNSQQQKSKELEDKEITSLPSSSSAVKEEEMDQDFDNMDADEGFPPSYKPTFPESHQSEDSFFADLGEIEADSLDLLLFDERESKGMDPFTFYDWGGNNNAAGGAAPSSSSAATEAKRDSS